MSKKQALFASSQLAQKMSEEFGDKARTVKVEMRYREQIKEFINKMEKAHKRAAHSKLVFR